MSLVDLIYLYPKSKRSVQNRGKNPNSLSWVTWNKYQLWTCKRYSIPRSVVQTPGNNQTNKIRGNKASRCLKPTDLDLLLIIDSSGSHTLTHTRTWTGKKVSLSNFDFEILMFTIIEKLQLNSVILQSMFKITYLRYK